MFPKMDFINKLMNRPKSMPASTPAMASDLEIESLLAEIQENLNHKNQVRRILFTRFQGLALFLLTFCFLGFFGPSPNDDHAFVV